MRPGLSVTIEVPATSANLGPGFDSLGLALNWYDRTTLTVIESGVEVIVTGEGAETVPLDETHLVVATIQEALSSWGVRVPGLRLEAHNTIPHGRGLGSSSAALVSGLLLAWAIAKPDVEVDRAWLLREAYRREGHADNVAPAVLGGFVITWSGAVNDSGDAGVRARNSRIHPDVAATALVPSAAVFTRTARGVLPAQVPFSVAVTNASRAALLVHAMGEEPELLLAATSDRLHQDYRAQLMPESFALVKDLRRRGFGAFISGAGPTVLVLHSAEAGEKLQAELDLLDSGGQFARYVLRPGNEAKILHQSPTKGEALT